MLGKTPHVSPWLFKASRHFGLKTSLSGPFRVCQCAVTTSRKLPSRASCAALSARGSVSVPTCCRLEKMEVACHALSVRSATSSDKAKPRISSKTRCVAAAALCFNRVATSSRRISAICVGKPSNRKMQATSYTLLFQESFNNRSTPVLYSKTSPS